MLPSFTYVPFELVNSLDALTLALPLGLKAARAKRKFACLVCESTDAMHAYADGGFHCFSCNRHWSNVDAAAAFFRETPREACLRIGAIFSIFTGASSVPPYRHAPWIPSVDSVRPIPEAILADLRTLGMVPSPPASIYTAAVDHILRLGPVGAAYLASRRLSPGRSARFGLRSIESENEWRGFQTRLRESWTPSELTEASLNRCPWGGIQPALLIPYRFQGEVVAVRFRALGEVVPKYQSLRGRPSLVPFNLPSLDACDNADVHVTEGELDALTLHFASLRAVGLPGAGANEAAISEIAHRVEHASRLVIWRDSDDAGDRFITRLCSILTRTHGRAWVRRHVVIRRIRTGKDVNELAQRFGVEALCQ